jgi:hypothetical protein
MLPSTNVILVTACAPSHGFFSAGLASTRHAASQFLSLPSRASVYFGLWWHERFPRPTGTPQES